MAKGPEILGYHLLLILKLLFEQIFILEQEVIITEIASHLLSYLLTLATEQEINLAWPK